MTLADSVETLGNTSDKFGSKRKSEEEEVQGEVLPIRAFQKSYMKVVVKKLLRAGMMPARTWRVGAVEMSPTEKLN